MDNKYIKLFSEIARSIEVIAEQAMEVNKEENDKKGEDAARSMRDWYANLHDRMTARDFNPSSLTKADYAKILVGATIAAQGIEKRLEKEKLALEGYKIDTIPKLNRLMTETKNDEEVRKLAEEIFTI